MKNKSTEELMNELKDCANVDNFLTANEPDIQIAPLPEYLSALLQAKNVSQSEIIKRSTLNHSYACHIFAGKKNPGREKIIALAIALQLNFAETQRLLQAARLTPLYIRSHWDSIIIHAINQQLTVIETNTLLDELGEKIFIE